MEKITVIFSRFSIINQNFNPTQSLEINIKQISLEIALVSKLVNEKTPIEIQLTTIAQLKSIQINIKQICHKITCKLQY